MPKENCERCEALKAWIESEIRSWKFISSSGGLTECGRGMLEALETTLSMVEEQGSIPSQLPPYDFG